LHKMARQVAGTTSGMSIILTDSRLNVLGVMAPLDYQLYGQAIDLPLEVYVCPVPDCKSLPVNIAQRGQRVPRCLIHNVDRVRR
jgi:hypothetical protein